MRLIDIKIHIERAYSFFDPKYSNSGNTHYIDNVQSLKIAIQHLYDAGIIERNSSSINIYTIIDSSMTDRIIVDSSQINGYSVELSKLKYVINVLHSWIQRYVPDEEDEETINIKLPQLYKIDDLIKASSLINKALSQSISEIGGEIKIKHLEYGSSWVIISAGTALAAKLILALANAAFKITQKYYGVKIMQQQYERYSAATEVLKYIQETNEKIIAYDTRILAEHMEKDFYPDSDNERIERLRVSITEMTKLIELGGEVHPSLITTSEGKTDIPDYNSLIGIMKSAGELPRNEESKSEGKEESPNEG